MQCLLRLRYLPSKLSLKKSAAEGILRYININKGMTSPQKVYNTEKKLKNYETDALKNNPFALLDNENSTAKLNGTSNSAPKPPPIFLREAGSNVVVKILTELVANKYSSLKKRRCRLSAILKSTIVSLQNILLKKTKMFIPFSFQTQEK